MNKITFSHTYKKMPYGVQHLTTWITEVKKTHYNNLTPEQIRIDTEIVDGLFYELPKTDLIVISLWSETIHGGHKWATMRRYTPEKMAYYAALRGQEVQIVIDPNYGKEVRKHG